MTSGTNPNTNRTLTNIEAWVDALTDYMATGFEKVDGLLATPAIADYVSAAVNNFVWASPLLIAQLAPKTFAASFVGGAFTGVFSYDTMMKIFKHADSILSGGNVKNTNFKVSIIFALIIANKISPIPIPSFPRVFAAGAGLALGIKASTWIPEAQAKTFAQFIDRYIPLPQHSSMKKK